MTLIVGNVVDVGLAGVDGTLRVWAGYRPEEVGLIAPVRRTWNVTAGELPGDVDVTPGPAMVQFNFGMDATADFPVVVPDVEQVTIQDLLLLHYTHDPFPVQEVMRDRLAAEAAAAESEGWAGVSEGFAGEALGHRDAAEVLAGTLSRRVDQGTRAVLYTSDGRPYMPDPDAVEDVPLYADQSVGTRVFMGDQMIYGDTGWRVLPPPDGWSTDTTAGRCAARRVGNRVEMEMRLSPSPALVGTSRTAPSGNTFYGVVPSGQGFRTSFRGAVGPTFLSSGNIGLIRLQSGHDTRMYWESAVSGTWQATDWITVQMAWTTSDPWPTSLPGTPV